MNKKERPPSLFFIFYTFTQIFFGGEGSSSLVSDQKDKIPIQKITREMQGIVGQASDLKLGGQLSAFCERLCQSPTGLSCRSFDCDR